MNALNVLEFISKEIILISSVTCAGFILIVKIIFGRKRTNKRILSKNMKRMLMRTKLFFHSFKNGIQIEPRSIHINNSEEIKIDKVNKMKIYVENLYAKCEKDSINSQKENEDKKISSKNDKIFCYLLKNVSEMIVQPKNND
jgi:hypothetical protein